MRLHYNFIRSHQSLKGQSSAEIAVLKLNLEENEVERGVKKERKKARNVCYTDQSEIRRILSLHTNSYRVIAKHRRPHRPIYLVPLF
jgi:hypothetical protein